jgi:hypothetical protein
VDPKDFILDLRQTLTNDGKSWITFAQITYSPTREYATKRYTTDAPEQGYWMARAWYLAVLQGREAAEERGRELGLDADQIKQLRLF